MTILFLGLLLFSLIASAIFCLLYAIDIEKAAETIFQQINATLWYLIAVVLFIGFSISLLLASILLKRR